MLQEIIEQKGSERAKKVFEKGRNNNESESEKDGEFLPEERDFPSEERTGSEKEIEKKESKSNEESGLAFCVHCHPSLSFILFLSLLLFDSVYSLLSDL